MYSIYTSIIKAQHGEPPWEWRQAFRAIRDSEPEDVIRAALAVGIAMGTHQERQRKKSKKTTIDAIEDCWRKNGAKAAMGCAYKGARYKKAAKAVMEVLGDDTALVMVALEIEGAAFRAGFSKALEMFVEAKRILEERQ